VDTAVVELIGGIALYLLPAIVAYRRNTLNKAAVAIVDIFLGWTLIGWVVALAMAASGKQEGPKTPIPPAERSSLPWQRWMNRED
jgi:hypothetical protein